MKTTNTHTHTQQVSLLLLLMLSPIPQWLSSCTSNQCVLPVQCVFKLFIQIATTIFYPIWSHRIHTGCVAFTLLIMNCYVTVSVHCQRGYYCIALFVCTFPSTSTIFVSISGVCFTRFFLSSSTSYFSSHNWLLIFKFVALCVCCVYGFRYGFLAYCAFIVWCIGKERERERVKCLWPNAEVTLPLVDCLTMHT